MPKQVDRNKLVVDIPESFEIVQNIAKFSGTHPKSLDLILKISTEPGKKSEVSFCVTHRPAGKSGFMKKPFATMREAAEFYNSL